LPLTRLGSLILLLTWLCLGAGHALAAPEGKAKPDAPREADKRQVVSDILAAKEDPAATIRLIETRIKELEGASDAETAKRLTELYRKALSNLEVMRNQEAKAAALAQTLENAPTEIQRLRKEIEVLRAQAEDKPRAPRDDIPTAELEQQLTQTGADEAALTARLGELDKSLLDWPQTLATARQSTQDARKALDDLATEVAQPAPEGETAATKEARLLTQDTRQRALRAELARLDKEILSQGVREDLLRAERDKHQLELTSTQTRVTLLREALSQRRLAEAEVAKRQAQAATVAASGRHALVGELAAVNADLTEKLGEATGAQSAVTAELTQLRAQAKRLEEEYRNTRQRMEISGLTEAMGQVLLNSRQQLPDVAEIERANREREHRIADASLREIRFNEDLQRLRDLDGQVDERLATLPPAEVTPELRAQVREQLERQRELLGQAQEANQAYLRLLGELDFAAQELLRTVNAYRDFLAQHLLWTRSAPPVMGLDAFTSVPRALTWLLSPAHWLQVGQVLLYEASGSPIFWITLVPLAWLLFRQGFYRRAILNGAERLRRVQTDSFRHTLAGLAYTLLLALGWPLLMADLGWRLEVSPAATAFTKGVGFALISVSSGFFSLRFFKLLCMPGGVADRHFRWTGSVLSLIRRILTWASALLVPIGFVVALLFADPNATFGLGLQRLSLIALMLGLTLFLARLIHPTQGVLQNYLALHPEGWPNRLRLFWYFGILAIPLGLSALALAGFIYTAATLFGSLVQQLWLILLLVILQQSILRWLGVTHRRLALQAALDHPPEHRDADAGPGHLHPVAERRMELVTLDEQTRRLLNAVIFVGALLGLWAIWSDVVPAFTRLQDVGLWTYMGLVDGEEKLKTFSLASVAFILATIAMATIAVRNLPALLEILLLDRFSVSSGARYAIKTLTAYILIALAVMTVSSTLGISWGRVQWLVAALSVGIGFGLQEIVANFISGIIILFERPVRVGDVVTIGQTTGTVTKIRIRATTVRNWDRQELLVPNKEFITNHLLNWTLSDSLNRVVISVGIDYNDDVRLAIRLMEEAVASNDRVLKEPPPSFIFERFGDSALMLQARCFVPEVEDRVPVISDLQQVILDKFRAHGISLAFPQRDIHLRASDPLEVRIRREGQGRPGPGTPKTQVF
jgi:potassium efflux system protein